MVCDEERGKAGRMRLINADELKEALIEAGQNSGGERGKDWSLTGEQMHEVIDHLPDVKFAYICDKTRCERSIYPWCETTSDIEHAAHFEKVQENIYYERETMNDQNIMALVTFLICGQDHFLLLVHSRLHPPKSPASLLFLLSCSHQ